MEKDDTSSAEEPIRTRIPGLGIVLAVLSALAFSACVVTAKMTTSVNPMFILTARSILQISLCSAGMIHNGEPFKQATGIKFKVFLAMLGLSGGLTNFLVYACLNYLQPADTIGILYCSPALVSFLACIWLKEPCTVIHALSVTLAVCGAVFVSKPSFLFGGGDEQSALHWVGCLLALAGSFTYSGIFIFSRLLPKIPAETSNFLIGVVSLVTSLPFCMSKELVLPSCGLDSFIFIASALVGTVAYVLLTAAPRFENATLVSVISSMEIVFTTPLQIMFLGELPAWNCYVGSVLIAISVFICGVLRCRTQHSSRKVAEKNKFGKLVRAPCLVKSKPFRRDCSRCSKSETEV